MTSEMNQFQLEFVLDTMNQYSYLKFGDRQERSKMIDDTIAMHAVEEKPLFEGVSKNKTFNRIMNQKRGRSDK